MTPVQNSLRMPSQREKQSTIRKKNHFLAQGQKREKTVGSK